MPGDDAQPLEDAVEVVHHPSRVSVHIHDRLTRCDLETHLGNGIGAVEARHGVSEYGMPIAGPGIEPERGVVIA
jgi:hypothetical protein